MHKQRKIALFANTDWYIFNFRLTLAKRLRERGYDVIIISPDGEYGRRFGEMGFRWIPLPMARRSLNLLKEIRVLIHLFRILVAEEVCIIHSFTIKCVVYGTIAGRIAGICGLVNSIAGLGYLFINEKLNTKILRCFISWLITFVLKGDNSRLIIQNSDDLAVITRRRMVAPVKTRLIMGSGVDCKRFKPRICLGVPAEGKGALRVLMASRLLVDKGIYEFVEAAGIVRNCGRQVSFILAGYPDEGNPASVRVGEVEKWVESGLLEWLGHVENMADLLLTIDVFVLPSYREGLPKSLIEAGACGVALITTNVPGCKHVVDHELNGLLVPAKDPLELANAISRLHDDVALRTRLGRAAREKVEEFFNEELINEMTIDLYSDVEKHHCVSKIKK